MLCAGEILDGLDSTVSSPGSPPGMSSSKSSKTSSLRSFNSDEDGSVAADVGHFEEIGLDDDTISVDTSQFRDHHIRSNPNPYSPNFTADLRAASARHVGPKIHTKPRDLARPRAPREFANLNSARQARPALATQFRDTSTQSLTIGSGPERRPRPIVLPSRGLSARSKSTSRARQTRSPSPNLSLGSLSPRDPNAMMPRRSSSLMNRRSRSAEEIEKECEEDEDDNIPDGLILDNVPLSPRPPTQRPASRPSSAANSPERKSKDRVRSVGNGTPPVGAEQGCLRSPTWKATSPASENRFPLAKGRAKSWNAAISELNAEAKALTEKLEEHADELDSQPSSASNRPVLKPRVKSALAELPPLRRSNIMIDPLPVSKEKEAVLSRTRPSWLPPKDPAEEKRHLKEYRKMVASSIEADKKREAARREMEQSKDKAANALMRTWEEDVLGKWDTAIHERRTKDLWWKGVAPRSRGAVWSRAIGNGLGLTAASFHAALARSREVEERVKSGKASSIDERRAAWFAQIQADAEERTWTELKIFQAGAPLHQSLIDVLRAYAMYRSDIGYVAGCNTVAALLLLNLDTPADAFVALANILNRSLPLAFFASDLGAQTSVCNLVHKALSPKSPRLDQHLKKCVAGADADSWLGGVFTALFTGQLSLELCTRLWDVYVFEGDMILVRAAAALLLDREMSLLGVNTTSELQSVLNSQPAAVSQARDDEFMARVRAMNDE
ncbi:hypothetical protein GGR56DRAFT_675512 [Xylariaceae sp. FL0804]|nr:hypothetical protein GGR56DRAFT_675512 [Xylariaceae sp. FL0804]